MRLISKLLDSEMKTPEQTSSINTLVGLVGNAACGKDTVASVFELYEFDHQSASDLVREEIVLRGAQISREMQTRVANEARALRGDAYFVRHAIERARPQAPERLVISGLYAPAEGSFIKSIGGYLVEVAAMPDDTIESQYSRITNRSAGSRDSLTLDEFKASLERENGGMTSGEANVGTLASMSDFKIVHDGRVETIRPQVEIILGAIS